MRIGSLLSLCLTVLTTKASGSEQVHNANHIFNAIHSSMRQWGSSLHHNGMSFFVASVPAGTQVYHGRSNNATVKGLEWVSFEPEHALMFAHFRMAPGPGRPGKGPPKPPPNADQVPFGQADETGFEPGYGWLQTYVTKSDMQFLYIDGTSAGKSDKGTLDSTDYGLLGHSPEDGPSWEDAEVSRAKGLCDMIKDDWQSPLSGIIRMEAGFEIIMCDFESSLDLRYQTTVDFENPFEHRYFATHFLYMRAVASRYHGIGAGRVTLDYDRMVTAYTEVDVPPEYELHRLNQTDTTVLATLRDNVRAMAIDGTPGRFAGTDWQAVADMLVMRYGDWLLYVTTPYISHSKERFERELAAILRPFTFETAPNATDQIVRCARQHLTSVSRPDVESASHSQSLAKRAIRSVAQHLCTTLVETARHNNTSLVERVSKLEDLIAWLSWTSFKQCRGCAANEICYIAAWPFGNAEDHWNPGCRNETMAGVGSTYWNRRPPGRPHPPGPPPDWQSLSFHGRVGS